MTAVATEFLMLNPNQQIICQNSDWNRRRRLVCVRARVCVCVCVCARAVVREHELNAPEELSTFILSPIES